MKKNLIYSGVLWMEKESYIFAREKKFHLKTIDIAWEEMKGEVGVRKRKKIRAG